MYLKSLEIQGFKSFPDKTVLTFGEDITAIVGPNGSGKSNISDAIRWVMGEQSNRAMRAGKMEDVIFGGTVKRKQTGYAEVTLVLDNSTHIIDRDETEVAVTRRYYRSGQSEYYINRSTCRLRDVNELFMDTGLGREGYSIIGQGKIDEILSVKSHERREIFEEAAGISRYRHRKEESEGRLKKTEENLLRINDKISELELQVEPLREQAEKAKKYLLLRDELRGLEISLWMTQLDRIRSGNSKLLADCAQAVRQRDEAKAQQENLYARTEELDERMRERDVRADELHQRQSQMEKELADGEGRLNLIRSQMAGNEENLRRVKAEMGDQQERSATILGQIEEREKRLAAIAEEKRGLQSDLMSREAEALRLAGELTRTGEELEALRRRESLENAAAGDAKALLSALAAASQELLDRDSALRVSIRETEEMLEQRRKEQIQSRKKLEEAREEKTSSLNILAAYDMKAQSRRKKVTSLNDRAVKLKMEDNALRSRIGMLSDMEKMYEGYNKAVKQLMGEVKRGGMPGVHAPVASLMRVEDEYTVAIEIALGGAMQNIVVDREEDGKKAISWLKRRDAGRATFLPLSVIRPNELKERGLENERGFVGIASELVTCQEKYRAIFANLLGRVVIAENMDSAIAIANRYGHRFRIVTLDGQVLNPGGSMTGGSVSRSAGILSRANELERLKAQAETLRADMERAEKERAEAQRELDALDYEVEAARGQLRQVEDTILRLEAEGSHFAVLVEGLEASLETSRADLAQLGSRSGRNEEDIEKARQRIAELEGKAAELRAEGENLLACQSELTAQGEGVSRAISEVKMELAALEAEREAVGEALEELRQLKEDLSGDQASRTAMLEEFALRSKELEEALTREKEGLETLRQRKRELDEQLRTASDEKLRLEGERSRILRESREKNDELMRMEREVSVLEQRKTAAFAEEKQLLDKLWDTYELSHSAAQQVRYELESVQKATRRAQELKRGISALGNVNVGAVEEFDRVNQRYTYLTEQRDDVEKSKSELLGIIAEITQEMKVIFAEQFKKIQESFSETFLELFGGGKATLELEDENNILDCGIEIKVQPPGKALKIITLLSGGEKAFVAIALYFAILKVRPTPFVVMDEIEAALDDSNVIRFARYLRNLTGKTQFIVITHRRGTMEEADVLYGVTMQEQGISRMLTINLNDVEKELKLKAN